MSSVSSSSTEDSGDYNNSSSFSIRSRRKNNSIPDHIQAPLLKEILSVEDNSLVSFSAIAGRNPDIFGAKETELRSKVRQRYNYLVNQRKSKPENFWKVCNNWNVFKDAKKPPPFVKASSPVPPVKNIVVTEIDSSEDEEQERKHRFKTIPLKTEELTEKMSKCMLCLLLLIDNSNIIIFSITIYIYDTGFDEEHVLNFEEPGRNANGVLAFEAPNIEIDGVVINACFMGVMLSDTADALEDPAIEAELSRDRTYVVVRQPWVSKCLINMVQEIWESEVDPFEAVVQSHQLAANKIKEDDRRSMKSVGYKLPHNLKGITDHFNEGSNGLKLKTHFGIVERESGMSDDDGNQVMLRMPYIYFLFGIDGTQRTLIKTVKDSTSVLAEAFKRGCKVGAKKPMQN
jgi:hypothetical protein